MRVALCCGPRDVAVYRWAFERMFGAAGEELPLPGLEVEIVRDIGVPGEGGEGEEVEDPMTAAWSDAELLRRKDFAAYGPEDRAAARRVLARLAASGPRRPSRRLRPSRRRGGEPDLRAVLRASLRYGGEPVERHWRRPGVRPRPLVLVADVSGSMAPYARMLLEYLQACVATRSRVEAFVFGTRLSRVTRDLGDRDTDRALERVAERVLDWSGGTRMGDALAELNRRHASTVGRGAVVVLLSDGWDRGEPDQLGAEMARLGRCAHRVIWLNPLAADPRYEPLTRAMQAAMPHVDRLLPGNSLASLEMLAELLEDAWS
jgi:uncharacterized protein with von Willebrand factor type A (vWA) domain